MKNYGLSPVAQPQSYGTTVGQSSTYIPAPISATPASVKALASNYRIVEFEYLRRKYCKTTSYHELEALISLPALSLKKYSGNEWTRFAQSITNRAAFTHGNAPGQIIIHDGPDYKESFEVCIELAETSVFFTKLYKYLGTLGRIDLPKCLDGNYRKHSLLGAETGRNFIYALQGFLLKSGIELWHKQLVNEWINKRIPEVEWLSNPELYPTMRVVSYHSKQTDIQVSCNDISEPETLNKLSVSPQLQPKKIRTLSVSDSWADILLHIKEDKLKEAVNRMGINPETAPTCAWIGLVLALISRGFLPPQPNAAHLRRSFSTWRVKVTENSIRVPSHKAEAWQSKADAALESIYPR
ncbi:hypothetical protein [Hymenobacter sp. AT01-02]|uniref:hypothetical protein n=1 Tax=Hymenobacter sp. AT01-02 TaxID=1571877 RepID=UPI000ACCF9FC|nr:hypothetical protein [Hymenobacter sp. AT01-02]